MADFKKIIKVHFEWIVLFTGLILLALMDPAKPGFSFCLFDAAGIFCPGEGLGKSISYIFRGMWDKAWASHPAGFLALPVLSFRIILLIYHRIIKPN